MCWFPTYSLSRDSYTYTGGWNRKADISFLVSAVPAVVVALTPIFAALSAFSWFIGAILAAAVHYIISRNDMALAESVRAATAAEAEPDAASAQVRSGRRL